MTNIDKAGLHIAHFMFALDPKLAGVANAVPMLCENLSNYGVKNSIMSFGNSNRSLNRGKNFIDRIRLSGTNLLIDRYGISGKYGFGSLWHALKIILENREANIVVIHQIYSMATFWGWIYAKRNRLPLVVMPHGTLTHYHNQDSKIKKIVVSKLVEHFFRDVQLTIATSEQEQSDISEISGLKALCLPYGINSIQTYSSRKRDLKSLRILFVGRFAAKKNLEKLIRSIPLVHAHYPETKLYIAGYQDLSEVNKLSSLADRLNLLNSIVFLPWQTETELESLYSNSDIFVLPSDNENYGLVVADALKFGVPCVITKAVGISDFVKVFNAGVVIEDSSAIKIAEGIIKCADLDYSTRSSNCLKLLNDKFSWKIIASNWKYELSEIINIGR